MELYRYFPGSKPLLISVPHAGTYVPEPIRVRLTDEAQALPDTDWHVDRLYDFAREMEVHLLIATHSRYVVDLNRGADDASLYPGRFTTGLVPQTRFDGTPLYRDGAAPEAEETKARVEAYWRPYHDQLREVLALLRATSPRVALFDAHSIRGEIPALFEGTLPDLNLGTGDGASADGELTAALEDIAAKSGYSHVLNGRFKGGYITRNYGAPASGIHAVQLELAQRNYMQEDAPYAYDERKAPELQATLRSLLQTMLDWTVAKP